MQPRVTLITLGVADVLAAKAFYQRLGFKASSKFAEPEVAFIQLGSLVLSLFGREACRADAGAETMWTGNGGIVLAHNVANEAEVDSIMVEAEAAGATILKRPQRAFWGGYHAFFADPDGHVWEIAHNPFFETAPDGSIRLPD